MDKETFNSMVEKYKNELIKYLKKNKAIGKESSTTPNIKKDVIENETGDIVAEEKNMTYQEFMDSNTKEGRLKIHSFCDDKIPLSGIRVRIKKNFSDGERVFFDGYTDDEGNIYDILLPAPDNTIMNESNLNGCPYAVYDVETFHDDYNTSCANTVKSFSHIESVYPIKIILPKHE